MFVIIIDSTITVTTNVIKGKVSGDILSRLS